MHLEAYTWPFFINQSSLYYGWRHIERDIQTDIEIGHYKMGNGSNKTMFHTTIYSKIKYTWP